ncbi:hypothetical protein [Planosporangium mesophilum]|nr:hypothetical protein [Planosporangium mesophilum]NJC83854.1 hypothetical protein [Planosporangium mesophilum]
MTGEAVDPSSFLAAAAVGVHRVPVPGLAVNAPPRTRVAAAFTEPAYAI